jgi:hypothetical protein
MTTISFTHSYKQPRAAFVACRDSLSKVEALARHIGTDTRGMLIISRSDNPALRTIDDIIAALPESVQLVILDDVEHLLPERERSPANIRAFLEDIHIRYAHRGLRIMATMTIEELDGLTWLA